MLSRITNENKFVSVNLPYWTTTGNVHNRVLLCCGQTHLFWTTIHIAHVPLLYFHWSFYEELGIIGVKEAVGGIIITMLEESICQRCFHWSRTKFRVSKAIRYLFLVTFLPLQGTQKRVKGSNWSLRIVSFKAL